MLTLTGPHRKFCEGIVQGMTATEAYALAYPKASKNTVASGGSRLIRKPEIEAEIAQLREKADAQAGSAVMSLIEKRAFLAAIVRTPVGSVREDSPLAEEMKVDAKGGTSVKLPCKLRAIELDAKLAGDLTPERDRDKHSARSEELEAALAELHTLMHGPRDPGMINHGSP